jgi:hypothetical protein
MSYLDAILALQRDDFETEEHFTRYEAAIAELVALQLLHEQKTNLNEGETP